MCEQVPSDLYQRGRTSKDTKVGSAEAVKQESFGVIAEKETDLKMKRLFRPRQITIELLSSVKGMNIILHGLRPVPINR